MTAKSGDQESPKGPQWELVERMQSEIDESVPFGWLAFWMLASFVFGFIMSLVVVADHLK